MVRRALLAGALTVSCAIAACSSDDSNGSTDGSAGSTTETVEPAMGIDAVLTDASMAMADVQSVRFTIEQTGAPVFIDGDKLIRFTGAEGRYAAPSSADALIEVNALGLDTKIGAVAIDGVLTITNPLTGTWEAAPADLSFDPAKLFDPDVGWSALLAEGLEDPSLVAERPKDGRTQVRATLAADRVAVLTGGLVDVASQIDIWIEDESHRVTEASFDADTSGGLTSWRLVLEDYGTAVAITRPEIGSRG